MDKGIVIFMIIGVGFFYLITNFIGTLDEEESGYQNSAYKQSHQYDKYKGTDSIGQEILVLKEADKKIQIAIWQSSQIKGEFLALFPNYMEMKNLIKERVEKSDLQKKLLKLVGDVEGDFFAGKLDAEQAKQKLDSLK